MTKCCVVYEELLYLVKRIQVDNDLYNEAKESKVKQKYESNDSREHVIDRSRGGNHRVR